MLRTRLGVPGTRATLCFLLTVVAGAAVLSFSALRDLALACGS